MSQTPLAAIGAAVVARVKAPVLGEFLAIDDALRRGDRAEAMMRLSSIGMSGVEALALAIGFMRTLEDTKAVPAETVAACISELRAHMEEALAKHAAITKGAHR